MTDSNKSVQRETVAETALEKSKKPLRFVAVGLFNTVIDFGLLFLLTAWGMDVTPANMISTGVALTSSFFLNRKYTFDASGNMLWQSIKFVVVTLIGLWGLQPLVIHGFLAISGELLNEAMGLFVGKVLATGVSMVWNYFLYDLFVFPKKDVDSGEAASEAATTTTEISK